MRRKHDSGRFHNLPERGAIPGIPVRRCAVADGAPHPDVLDFCWVGMMGLCDLWRVRDGGGASDAEDEVFDMTV